jgi:hypothetical protein
MFLCVNTSVGAGIIHLHLSQWVGLPFPLFGCFLRGGFEKIWKGVFIPLKSTPFFFFPIPLNLMSLKVENTNFDFYNSPFTLNNFLKFQ